MATARVASTGESGEREKVSMDMDMDMVMGMTTTKRSLTAPTTVDIQATRRSAVPATKFSTTYSSTGPVNSVTLAFFV